MSLETFLGPVGLRTEKPWTQFAWQWLATIALLNMQRLAETDYGQLFINLPIMLHVALASAVSVGIQPNQLAFCRLRIRPR